MAMTGKRPPGTAERRHGDPTGRTATWRRSPRKAELPASSVDGGGGGASEGTDDAKNGWMKENGCERMRRSLDQIPARKTGTSALVSAAATGTEKLELASRQTQTSRKTRYETEADLKN